MDKAQRTERKSTWYGVLLMHTSKYGSSFLITSPRTIPSLRYSEPPHRIRARLCTREHKCDIRSLHTLAQLSGQPRIHLDCNHLQPNMSATATSRAFHRRETYALGFFKDLDCHAACACARARANLQHSIRWLQAGLGHAHGR